MPDTPPPTTHTLRPHHITLLKILMLAFHHYEAKQLPPPFLLHVYRVTLNEVAEIVQPRSYADLMNDIGRAPLAHTGTPQQFIKDLSLAAHDLNNPQRLANFLTTIPILFLERDDDDTPRLHTRSIFGYFARRCFVSFAKLAFGALSELQWNYMTWVQASGPSTSLVPAPGYGPISKDNVTNDYQILKTRADKKTYATPEAYAQFEKSIAVGDVNIAGESLRRFFEQYFHEGTDSGLRQHALLSLARMHFISREYSASRKFLQEAVSVARSVNDKTVLSHAISMLNRMPVELGKKPVINEIQPDRHPLEVLYDVKKLMQVDNQHPLSACFERIVQAVGLYDHWTDTQQDSFTESEQWCQHAVQSVVWNHHGCVRLGEIEEDIVTAFTEVGGDDHNRLVVTINRAYQRARQGKYENAIALLLEPDVWRGISLTDYSLWASEIWHTFALRASRRGQVKQFNEWLRQKRPRGHYNTREYWFWSTGALGSMIRDPLYEVIQMRRYDSAYASVEQLLNAVWHAEFQSRFGLYRTGVIMLADIGLEFGMTKWCRRILEEIMPQVITGSDLEQRAFACFTLARCIIAAGESSPASLQECIPYLQIAEQDFAAVEVLQSLQDVQFLQSVVYHNLGLEKERDEAAARHWKTESECKEAAVTVVEDWITEVWDIVADVGAALVAR